ncbi:MAG: two-component regulator propeller domain-containing protein [Thermoanaerobaculia bacterium]
MPWWLRYLALALAMIVPGAATARGEFKNVRFRHLTLDDGLPSAGIQSVLQDHDGFIWLGSQNGLSRFDGFGFTNYQHDAGDPTSLSHDFVWDLLEDREGVLWVGTDGGGLSRFSRSTGSFTRLRHDPSEPSSLSDDRVRAVLEDRKGVLWVGTDGGGLERFDRQTQSFTHFRHDPEDPSSLGGDLVRALFEDRLGLLWVATDGGGLSALNPATGVFTRFRHDPENPSSLSSDRVRCVFEDSNGGIWAGTYDGGLNRLDPVARRVDRFLPDEGSSGSLGSAKVRVVFEDTAGTLWVGTDDGLDAWQPATNDFRHYRHEATDPYSLSHDTVISIFEDRGGVLWVGTFAGLNTWNTATGDFHHYRRRSEQPSELSNDFVTSFAEDRDGSVWVGTFGGGLSRLDRATGEFTSYRNAASDPTSLSDDRVMSLLVDREGVLWVGTLNGGLNRLDRRRGRFDRFQHDPDDPSSLAWNGVTVLLEDQQSTLWVGTWRGGLHRFDGSRQSFVRYRHDPSDPRSLSSDRVTALYEDRTGTLWVGTEVAGLNRLARETGGFVHYRHDPADPRSLSGDGVFNLVEDTDGNLWIGTRGAGLNRWSAADRQAGTMSVRRYGLAQGLRSNIVFASALSDQGDLWLSSDRGLARMDPRSGELTHYDASHGLQSNDFNFAAAMRARSGELFFGGVHGFNVFAPAAIRSNRHPPAVVLTDFLKFNSPVAFDRPLGEVDEIRLGYKDSVVAFEFAGLDYSAPEKNRYMYKLEGFDRDWIDSGALHRATYTNLRPGGYVFRARASNNDGVWNDEGLTITLLVAAPPWRSWWAYGVYSLALVTVAVAVIRSQRRKRRHSLELERANTSLKIEIHDRQAKERALEAEKLKAQEYLNVAEVIMVALDEEGRVCLINQKGCRVLGYEEHEIVGSRWVERFVPAELRAEVQAQLEDVGDYQYYEHDLVTRVGERRIIAWHSTRFASGDDSSPIVLSSGSDITQMRELEKQVRMSQKMEALGTLAGGIAHDFNNILTAVYGYSSLTLDSLPADSEEAEHVEQVVRASERARDLVARILTFSRRDERPREPVALGPVVQEACELLRSSLSATIRFRVSVDPQCPAVIADPGQIHQVVMNLGTNAAHALEAGGELEVRLESVELSAADLAQGCELGAGPHVRLTVRDTGHGMDSDTLERMFDPFFTTKKAGSGTGLGLSVVHGIVKAHGGDLGASSEPGEGTTLVIHFPACGLEVSDHDREEAPVTGKECILFVDDEKSIALLAKKMLEAAGYEVVAFTSGREALRAFKSQPDRFQLLVTDQLMPEITGAALIEEMRDVRPDLPVVVASGTRKEDPTQRLGHAFLQKPFSPAEISRKVRQVLDEPEADASVN